MKIGIFGGSFDPPHIGHLIVADDVAAALELDVVRFVPTGVHPLKGARLEASGRLRLAMVRAATADSCRFVVDDREIRRDGPSYTIDTIRELESENPGAELFLIVGEDILGEFHRWHRVEEIGEHSRIAVMSRAGASVTTAAPKGLDVVDVEVTNIGVSSSDVRNRVRTGRPYRYLVPDAVREIIEEHSLYKD
jgi:nicotinate-nucleotide adenylyltransferase